jgi:hypothetical protein
MRKFALIVAVLAFSSVAFASPIYSTCTAGSPCVFDMSGRMTATANTITFESIALAPNQFALTPDAVNPGVFAAIPAGTLESIQNLNQATEPVGTPFGPFAFMAFPNPAGNGLVPLEINFIFPGIFTATGGPPTGCNIPPAPAVGQSCTPNGSPFSFTNVPNAIPGLGPASVASLVVSGVSADGTALWTTDFSISFALSYQRILAKAFGPGGTGFVSEPYSATTTVVGIIPEPGSAFLTITGVFLTLAAALRRRK